MKNLLLCVVLAATLSAASLTEAKVTVEVLNPGKGDLLVTYEFPLPASPYTEFRFPVNGTPSPDQPLDVLSITEKNTEQRLGYEILPFTPPRGNQVAGRYIIKTNLPETDRQLEFKIVLHNQADCHIDDDGRLVLQYETAHSTTFLLPEGFHIVSSNLPFLIGEEDGRTSLQWNVQLDKNNKPVLRTILIKAERQKGWLRKNIFRW